MAYEYQAWPCACDGPNGEKAIFNSEAEVPKGWGHHDVKPKKGKATEVEAEDVPEPEVVPEETHDL